MFKISDSKIDPPKTEHAQTGARVVFEGIVRNHNEGRDVNKLEYEAFSELAEDEGTKIIEEAKTKFDAVSVSCTHRVGILAIGDTAVWVEATSAHRKAAFDACQYVIDEVKRRVPIWKREVYTDGEGEWLHADPVSDNNELNEAEKQFYDRQMRVPSIGEEGQQKLKATSILVVGAGGLGCPALQYLAGAGIGRIGICDMDIVERSNIHRQPLFATNDIGRPKAQVAAEKIRALNPSVIVEPITNMVTKNNAETTIENYDIILDCTDSIAAKIALSDACVKTSKPLVQSSIFQIEGQIHVWTPNSEGGCLRCQWKEIPDPSQIDTCREVGTVGPVPGLFGVLQAWEAIRISLTGTSPLADKLYLFDLEQLDGQLLQRPKRNNCPTCGCGKQTEPEKENELAILITEFAELNTWKIIDIRDEDEIKETPIEGIEHTVAHQSSIENKTDLIDDKPTLLICARGVRSVLLADQLRAKGHPQVFALTGGARTLRALVVQSRK